jgi:integrase
MKLAVWPLELRQDNPFPEGWIPRLGPRKALGWLYPDEEAQLIACDAVPVEWRMLYGFLSREGVRVGEARNLTWAEVDLERGLVRLDANKTDEPRTWKLGPDVVESLRQWRALRPSDGYVFVGEDGERLAFNSAAEMLREHLLIAGVTRAELFERSARRLPVRIHDLRASFATVSLATGKTETWVRDRTGHTTSDMLERYRRQARTAQELEIQWFSPMDRCLHLASRGGLGQKAEEKRDGHWMPYSFNRL